MKVDHHRLLHAFPGAPSVFLSPQGNTSTLGLDLDNIINHVPKKNVEISRLAFSFVPNYIELKIFW
jgi:hypothetical protein